MALIDLVGNNKNLAKRVPVSANFKFNMEQAGGITLPEGIHSLGFLESNIVITRVTRINPLPFDGTTPVARIYDSDGVEYFTSVALDSTGAGRTSESTLTAPDGVTGQNDPIYKVGKTEFFVDVTLGGSTVGEASVMIDYVQADTELGLHA
jgi:hypothetical protein